MICSVVYRFRAIPFSPQSRLEIAGDLAPAGVPDLSYRVRRSEEETDVMRKGRFSEEQIITILREQEAGMATAEVCRRHGISTATFYAWKSKYGGLEVSDAKRLRT